ncbi:MAG: carboxypeptidase regulatory-like domain-containing protein [Acidobacteriota bacterium]|nr:carboxypeptidase regulatory-like domain-containing protein [Acidobacteriota bacterium]
MNKGRTLCAAAVLILAAGLAGFAQAQSPNASLRGRIVDAAGKPLTLASVIIQSPAFQGQADQMTIAGGTFDFLSLPPGVYTVRIDFPEHKSVIRRGVVLMAGQTVKLNIVLEPSELEEEAVDTTGRTGVDVTADKGVIRLSSTLLEAIPLQRDISAVQALAPGAVTQDRPYNRAVSIQGGSVRGQDYRLDGGQVTDPSTGFPIGNLNVDILDQVEIISTGKPASEGTGRGAVLHLLSRSGGNAFTGSLRFHMTGDSFSSDLFDADAVSGLALAPSDRTSGLYDASLNLGGPLWEDRVWYFLNARYLSTRRANPYDPGARLENLGTGDASTFDRSQTEWMTFFKATVNVTDKIRYSGYFHWSNLYQLVDEESISPDTAFDATWIRKHENSYATSHTGTFDLSPKLWVDIHGTYIERDVPQISRDAYDYTYVDYTQQVTWGAAPYSIKSTYKRTIGEVNLTAYLDKILGADHVFKAGLSIEESGAKQNWWRINPYYSMWYDWAAGNPYYVDPVNSIGRLRIVAAGATESSLTAKNSFRRFSIYAQDSIQAGRLALNLGLRFDYSLEYLPAQTRSTLGYEYAPELNALDLADNDLLDALSAQFTEAGLNSPFEETTLSYRKLAEFVNLSPRAGLSYDMFGDGSTALKFSFSRDYESLWTGLYGTGNIFSPQYVEWDWYDLNGDQMMDLPGTDEYVLVSAVTQDTALNPFSYTDSSGVTHKIKAPRTDTFTASLEREFLRDFTVGAQFTLRNTSNLVSLIDTENGYDYTARDGNGLIWLPMTVKEPGQDGLLGTSDDQSLTVYGLRADRPAPVYKYANIPEARQKYAAGILTLDKRLSHGWQMAASIVVSSFKGNLGADAAASYASTMTYASPNGLTNSYGPLWLDRPFQAKIMAGVELPYKFFLGAYFRYLSGAPYGRTLARVYFPDGFGARTAYVTVSAESLGVGREPAFSSLDLRLQRGFRVGKSGQLDLYLDVFNLLGSSALIEDNDPAGILRTAYDANGNPVSISYTASSTYGTLLSYYGVRTIRLGAKLNF